jgi:hypothetical protein
MKCALLLLDEIEKIMSIGRISLFIALIIHSGQLLASDRDMKINTMSCKVVDSTTRTFEVGDSRVKNYSWMGSPKKDSQLNIDFKIVGNGCMVVGFNYLPLIELTHMIDFENKEIHSEKNWIKTSDSVINRNELTLYRNGIRIRSNWSRSSLDIRKRTAKDWDGHIVLDMLGDNDINSLQLISLSCRLGESWDYLMEFIINKKSCKK